MQGIARGFGERRYVREYDVEGIREGKDSLGWCEIKRSELVVIHTGRWAIRSGFQEVLCNVRIF